MDNNLSSILIQPNSEEEKQYCKKNNIELKRLKNGILILGIPCRKDFTSFAHIKYEFSEGSFRNEPGSVHFLEHFINKRARPIALHNLLEIRAWTGPIELGEEISGIANPEIKDFGIWTVLSEIKKSLESPLSTVNDIQKTIETEREVIKAEIKKQEFDHNFQVYKHFVRTFYSSENPLYAESPVIGKEQDVDKLTMETLKKVQNKVLVANNLLISFYTEGDLNISQTVMKKLTESLSSFPEGKRNESDKSLLEKINLEAKPGKMYRTDPGLKNGIITIEFVWKFNHPFPSKKYFGLNILKSEIENELFAHSRKLGWGYFTDVNLIRPFDNVSFLRLRIDMRKDNKTDLTNGIKEILASLKNITESAIEIENKRQMATPMNAVSRLSWAVDGIKDHGAMINADRIREIMLKVKAKHLDELINEMLEVKPVIIITGDLG